MKDLVYIVPCHRKPERCFHIKGKPIPLCTRCMGILLGFIAIPFLLYFQFALPFWVSVCLQVPMVVDGYTQLKKWRMSTNLLRVTTGLVSGFGLANIVVYGSFLLVHIVKQL
jgi:uncharacterized membrane protein